MALLPDRLSAGDLELKRVRVDMCDQLLDAAMASYSELHPWMTWAAGPLGREDLQAFLVAAESHFDENIDWTFALVEVGTGDIVGTNGLHFKDDPRCVEIGYWVRTDRTRRGYASSAAGALTEAAFAYLDVDRVQIRMDKANIPSASVPPKIGFTLLGEVSRAIELPGHSGTSLIWFKDRPEKTTGTLQR
jgi:RimJ/RimL family protein N-acetyltransferase